MHLNIAYPEYIPDDVIKSLQNLKGKRDEYAANLMTFYRYLHEGIFNGHEGEWV